MFVDKNFSGGSVMLTAAAPGAALAVRSAGSQPPLFIVPAGAGDATRAFELAAHIDSDVPVYALPWPEVLPASMDALADRAIRLMREVRKQGPYRILGAASGARLAYAVAQHLEALDEPMDFVGLIDCDDASPRPGLDAFDGLWSTCFAQPLHGLPKLHVFRATALDSRPPAHVPGWHRLLSSAQTECVPVPGTRTSMREPPHLAGLGRMVGKALRAPRTGHHAKVHEPAILLHAGEEGLAPIVCVPGAGASVTSFVSLSVAMGDSRPLLGMQPRGVVGGMLPYGSVELAARRYLDALPAAGVPVHLLGHSFGGWVAFEMALQLSAAGRAPASVTLVDVGAPDGDGELADRSRQSVIDQFLASLALRTQQPLAVDLAQLHALDNDALITELHRVMVRHGLMPARSRPDVLRGTLTSFARSVRTTYRPARRHEGPVHLVQVPDRRAPPDQDARERAQYVVEWGRHAASLKTWQGPGNHLTILDTPHVEALAHWWKTTVLPTNPG